jgi:hypothetical protein
MKNPVHDSAWNLNYGVTPTVIPTIGSAVEPRIRNRLANLSGFQNQMGQVKVPIDIARLGKP